MGWCESTLGVGSARTAWGWVGAKAPWGWVGQGALGVGWRRSTLGVGRGQGALVVGWCKRYPGGGSGRGGFLKRYPRGTSAEVPLGYPGASGYPGGGVGSPRLFRSISFCWPFGSVSWPPCPFNGTPTCSLPGQDRGQGHTAPSHPAAE